MEHGGLFTGQSFKANKGSITGYCPASRMQVASASNASITISTTPVAGHRYAVAVDRVVDLADLPSLPSASIRMNHKLVARAG